MEPTATTSDTDMPKGVPIKTTTNASDNVPNKSIKDFNQVVKPGVGPVRKVAIDPERPAITSGGTPNPREAPIASESTPSPKKTSSTAPNLGHKKTDSGDSNSSTTRIAASSDRAYESDIDLASDSEHPRAKQKEEEMKAIGSVFPPRK